MKSKILSMPECLEIFKEYDKELYDYYKHNAYFFGADARRYAEYLQNKYSNENISAEQFTDRIKGIMNVDDDHLSFSVMSNMYFADYHPKYPDKSAADLIISLNWITGESEIRGNLQAAIPTIKKYKNFQSMLKDLEGIAEEL